MKKFKVNGKEYTCIAQAERELEIPRSLSRVMMKKRDVYTCADGRVFYLDYDGVEHSEQYYRYKKGNRVWVDGVEYFNYSVAERELGIIQGTIAKVRYRGGNTYSPKNSDKVYNIRFEQ